MKNSGSRILTVTVISMLLLLLASCQMTNNPRDLSHLERLKQSFPLSVKRWYAQLINSGQKFCNKADIQKHQLWEGGIWYYDGARVYYQLADFTGQTFYDQCAEEILSVYRNYVLQNNGAIPGWRVFPHGLAQHYARTGNRRSREAVLLLATNSAFAHSSGGIDPEVSRETAYLIHAFITARTLGLSSVDRQLQTAVNFSLAHLDAWTLDEVVEYVKPFMVALSMEALIAYHHESPSDKRVLPAVRRSADWLWQHAWIPSKRSFLYIHCKTNTTYEECNSLENTTAPDLNLLIAPAYAWLYAITGEEKYGTMADAIFLGGVEQADLHVGKRFSQNFRWSFKYLDWKYGITSIAYLN